MTLQAALDAFLSNQEEFKRAVESSTRAGFENSSYSVELFPSGTYRVLWTETIGERYESPGLILEIPTFDHRTVQYLGEDDDYDVSFALSEIAAQLREAFAYAQEVS
jgi:hypothetical protein